MRTALADDGCRMRPRQRMTFTIGTRVRYVDRSHTSYCPHRPRGLSRRARACAAGGTEPAEAECRVDRAVGGVRRNAGHRRLEGDGAKRTAVGLARAAHPE